MSDFMEKTILTLSICMGIFVLNLSAQVAPSVPVLRINADQVTSEIGPTFSGMMTEEINHSYDGGLYAELVQNRVFKDNPTAPVHWSLVQTTAAIGSITLDNTNALNDELVSSLRLDVGQADKDNPVGIANDGYWGIPVKPETAYQASFYAKTSTGFKGPVVVAIVSTDGSTIFAQATVDLLGNDWRKYSVKLITPANLTPTTAARFELTVHSPGTVWFNLVSLFPPTWKNRPNGNRIDLMQKLADMKPGFLRFPGGNYLEG